jgi:hypothetical protein
MFPSDELRSSVTAIAETADKIKEGAKVFQNPSGSAPAAALIGGASALATAVASGQFHLAAAMLGMAGAANVSARLMTNDAFVEWLAKSTTLTRTPQNIGQMAGALGLTLADEPQHIRDDASIYLNSVNDSISSKK